MTDLHGVALFRRAWMLAGFAAAFLIGDMFLAVRGAAVSSVEFLYGVAGFSLAQVLWNSAGRHPYDGGRREPQGRQVGSDGA